ncbi:hypothetical protein BD560DRAFT_457201 [Blakeslea trispora]|nr:hypothetical protein BD560DRAFT_457201 [Blakeslea trispora]
MQSVIHSSYVGVFFPHAMEVDHIEEKTYFLLYEPYKAVKVIANLSLVQEMIQGYDNEWSISRMGEKKDPLIILVTGVMKQQPTVRAFLGRVVEEKFHMQALSMTIIPGIPLIPERLKEMVHPEIAPIQLGEGIKEGYFYVNLSMNQDLQMALNFTKMKEQETNLQQGTSQQQRRNQEERGDEVEIPDSHDNDDSRAQNPYYTDDDEPYIPTENPAYVRRMSDSSLDSDLRQVNDQIEESMTDETLRFANNDLNQVNDPEERPNERNFQPAVSIDDAESSGSKETVTLSKQNTARKPRTLKNNQHLTNNHASGMRDTSDSYNGK